LTAGRTLVLVATSPVSSSEITGALAPSGFTFELEAERFFPLQRVPQAAGIQVSIGRLQPSGR